MRAGTEESVVTDKENATGAVTELVAGMVAAWNSGDPRRFAELFTEEADYVTSRGAWVRGRGGIEVLRASSGALHVVLEEPPSVRMCGDAAIAHVRWAIEESGAVRRRGLMSCVAVRRDGGWLFDLLHNTDTV